MQNLKIQQDKNNPITYISSINKSVMFSKELLEHFLKPILFDKDLFLFISYNMSMDELSYQLLDLDVDNIHGYTIPYSELDNDDLQNVSIMALNTYRQTLRWLEHNIADYGNTINRIRICLLEPYSKLTSDELVNIIHTINSIPDRNIEFIIGSTDAIV